ncbi:hypothetical protein NJC38_22740 [Pseudomonas sp. 21LCFQ010]|uniref:hypothetical protein n=1 Tax=Pseudomonas sp. 21LCFQ010 TaxID=2957506 RepID=UPI00209865CC|nr:hypothetical protein [Pseudomonas sp. 21LCFQ010]MCO8164961.1 hypothetical protein [Pseudomonas sp. 21LCFQ010]
MVTNTCHLSNLNRHNYQSLIADPLEAGSFTSPAKYSHSILIPNPISMPPEPDDYAPIIGTTPVLRQGNSDPVFKWTVKRINLPRKTIWLTLILFSIFPAAVIISLFDFLETDPGSFFWLSGPLLATTLSGLYFMLRTSTFDYRIYPECGEVDVQLYYPKYTKHFFKGIGIILIISVLALAAFMGSILFLLVSVPPMIISALNIMEWKPPPCELETSMVWEKYNAVTVDRRYRIIVIHRTDLTIGFEARLPNKVLFEQYLAFLRTVLPEVTTYREEVWKW